MSRISALSRLRLGAIRPPRTNPRLFCTSLESASASIIASSSLGLSTIYLYYVGVAKSMTLCHNPDRMWSIFQSRGGSVLTGVRLSWIVDGTLIHSDRAVEVTSPEVETYQSLGPTVDVRQNRKRYHGLPVPLLSLRISELWSAEAS